MSVTTIKQDETAVRTRDGVAESHLSGLERRSALVPVQMRRPHVRGKFLFVGEEKFWIRGVTYGTFGPDDEGVQLPRRQIVEQDFRAIADAGINAIRIYTVPPIWLMDAAAACGMRVMIGIPWEQHVTFLDDGIRARRIISDIRQAVRQLGRHPAVLCYAVASEITASVVRWYGKERIERFIKRLYTAVKSEDPEALVTYVNFPTTEYLDLPFLDFVSFNVYLESKERFGSYLAHLQNIAGERPLIMAEIGLDSQRNGEARQAESLDWQIASTFEAGCAGVFVFAWTDEWFRGGSDIKDWDFGLTTRDRQPKPALRSVSVRFANAPFFPYGPWPKISVIVCSYNGARAIDEALAALEGLDYPDYEIIVIDDGSTDQTSAIAGTHNVRLIRTKNNGLSVARNEGLNAATGEIVVFIDDDAYPDPHWLAYLATAFLRTEHAGIGGPNIAPPGDGVIADCVANAPGGPVHVLLSDEIAEHIPGCNMAYRRDRLMAIGGFDPRFRVAGDDVDICWRLQEQGWTLGFAPAAVVWHHPRNSIRNYFKQQRGYAKAEALLADKWPGKYNRAGQANWQGRLYGRGLPETLFQRGRIYYGVWGSAPFQSIYEPGSGHWSLMQMPEWYFVLFALGALTALGALWKPMLWLSPLLMAGIGLTAIQAACAAKRAHFHAPSGSKLHRLGLRCLVGCLYLIQPAARLLGRVEHGIGPWRWKGFARSVPLTSVQSLWSEQWQPVESRLLQLKSILEKSAALLTTGDDFCSWDFTIHGGLFGSIRIVAMVEEHGNGQQLCRFRAWPTSPSVAVMLLVALATLAALAALDHAWVGCVSLALVVGALGLLIYADCATAMSQWHAAINEYLRCNEGVYILPQINACRSLFRVIANKIRTCL